MRLSVDFKDDSFELHRTGSSNHCQTVGGEKYVLAGYHCIGHSSSCYN